MHDISCGPPIPPSTPLRATCSSIHTCRLVVVLPLATVLRAPSPHLARVPSSGGQARLACPSRCSSLTYRGRCSAVPTRSFLWAPARCWSPSGDVRPARGCGFSGAESGQWHAFCFWAPLCSLGEHATVGRLRLCHAWATTKESNCRCYHCFHHENWLIVIVDDNLYPSYPIAWFFHWGRYL